MTTNIDPTNTLYETLGQLEAALARFEGFDARVRALEADAAAAALAAAEAEEAAARAIAAEGRAADRALKAASEARTKADTAAKAAQLLRANRAAVLRDVAAAYRAHEEARLCALRERLGAWRAQVQTALDALNPLLAAPLVLDDLHHLWPSWAQVAAAELPERSWWLRDWPRRPLEELAREAAERLPALRAAAEEQ